MKALGVVIGLVVILAAAAAPAGADEVRPTVFQPNPFAMTPPPAPLGPRPPVQVPAQPPHVRPPVVYPCCTAVGYWAYQWVPTTYTTYVWVPGYVTDDGTMVAGGYQPQVVSGGYYQPVWVSGY